MSRFGEQLCRKNRKLHLRKPGNRLNLNRNYSEYVGKGNRSSDATCVQMLLLGAMICSHSYKP